MNIVDSEKFILTIWAKREEQHLTKRSDINLSAEDINKFAFMLAKDELERKLALEKIDLYDSEKEMFKREISPDECCSEIITEEQILRMKTWNILGKILVLNKSLLENIDFKKDEEELLEYASEEEKKEYWLMREEEKKTNSPKLQFVLGEFLYVLTNRKKSSPIRDIPDFPQSDASLFFAIKAMNQGYLPALDTEKKNLRWKAKYKKLAQLLLVFLAKKGNKEAKGEIEFELQTTRYPHNIPRLFEYNPDGLGIMLRL